MPTFQSVINAIKTPQECYTRRQELIKEIEHITGRRVLVYVADTKKPESALNDEDKTGFSDLIQDIKATKVDFLVNSPGGFAEVTEAIVGMIRSKYKGIRFVIPNMAKSAATLLVLSGDELLMDERSELGPIDPQVAYFSTDGLKREAAEDILEGFKEAKEALVKEGPAAIPAYAPLLNKYTIGLLRGCRNAMQLSQELAEKWLKKYMFAGEPESQKPKDIAGYFASHANTLSHLRAIRVDKCKELGLKIADLSKQENKDLLDKYWELWCLYQLHFERTPVYKIYENSEGCYLQRQSIQIQIIPRQFPSPGQPRPPAEPSAPTK